MAVVYSATLKDTRMNAVLNAVDAQTTAGTLEIGTSGMATVLATLNLSKPSFSEASQMLTMLGMPKSATAANTGAAASARIKDGLGNIIISGLTVGTSGTDINLNSTAVSSGQSVTLSSATITHG